ncbi:glycosyltransferase family 2 protein [Bacilliculturomica massiliensis]|uniref:glycosyltransferase family 2 protein n=1 Tax=Bacilliculturomica massiliensis TaxID=1917867 RepID=UPI001030BE1E|nr:glycosyltransferase family 2 protein [Bacilliculturomica massiliensis]
MARKAKSNTKNSKSGRELAWIYIAVLSMTVYVVWRIFFTIPEHQIYGWFATVCGMLLVASETISMLEGSEHFFRLRKKNMPEKPEVPLSWFPHIDILIATHNEETELLYKTVNGCKHMDYPDKGRVHIYICDDGNRPEMAKLAAEMGVGYCTLEENRDAKAGNLNNAIQMTGSPWIVTFDADMIPTHDFLMETVPYTFLPRMKQLEDGSWRERTEEERDEDYRIGFIQTPQSFYNPDLFQFNFFSEQRIPNEQDFFFREINVGRNSANASIYAGSNTLISRQALEDVGGIATGTITEDFETGILIQAKGYTCYAFDQPLAHGLAPTDVDSLIRQRRRWGRGCISSLRRVRILRNPNLKLNTKLSYISCLLYWWTFARRFVYIVCPILFVLFGIPVVICGLPELVLIWLPSYLLYNHALKVTSGRLRTQRWSNIVDTTIFPYMILPILMETLFIQQKKFDVTNKTRTVGKKSDLPLAAPHMILLLLDAAALLISVRSAVLNNNFGAAIIIYWLAVNGLNLVMAVFFMVGRRNLRANDRFRISVPVEVHYRGTSYYGETADLSETGLSLMTQKAIYLPDGNDTVGIHLKSERYETRFKARTVQVAKRDGGWQYGLEIVELEGKNKDEYYQMLYDHHHSLADQIHRSVSVFEDVFINIHRRAQSGRTSNRKLPRVDLDLDLETGSGTPVRAVNCNYKYILLTGAGEGQRELELLIPGCSARMRCVRPADGNPKAGLFAVVNWEELLFEDAYEKLFAAAENAAAQRAEEAGKDGRPS